MNSLTSLKTPAVPDLVPTIQMEIRQHNALINSPFMLSTLEWRAFNALLQRVGSDDDELKEHFIPVAELVDTGKGGGKAYAQIAELSDQITDRKLRVEQLGPNGERLKQPDYRVIPLLALASYVEKRGGVVLVLNPLFRPYLLQLTEKGNFTKSQVAELKHLKANHSHKIYWLLSEYRAFGVRIFTVSDLRFRLGIKEDEYKGRFDNFKAKVLDKMQGQLAQTDLAFQMEFLRKGRVVEQIRFTFSARPLQLKVRADSKAVELSESTILPDELVLEPWAQQLRAKGVSVEGCELIRRHLAEGQYSEAYLDHVLMVLQKPRKTPIRKPADYLFKCITGKLLLDEFERSLLPPVVKSASPTGAKGTRAPVIPATPTEKVFNLVEVRQMYDNPGPFAKRLERGATFEEHLQQIYLSQGFVLENRGGKDVLVLRELKG